MTPILVSGIVYVINIPFGYWRKSVRRFSLYWFLAIHIPVIISILLRYLWNIDFKWEYLILFIFMFFAGQFTGKQVFSIRNKQKGSNLE